MALHLANDGALKIAAAGKPDGYRIGGAGSAFDSGRRP